MKRIVNVGGLAGYCFGVRRALDLARDNLSRGDKKVYSLGPIIHNPNVVEEFRSRGMTPIGSIDEIDEGVLVIRSHGVEREVMEGAAAKGLEIVDATCPFVKKAQRIAEKLSEQGYRIVIVGERAHPEVRGIMSYAGDNPIIVTDASELPAGAMGPRIGVLSQTTKPKASFIKVVEAVLDSTHECRAYNTICNATLLRQAEAMELAESVEAMFVVGGKNSANTRRLAELCASTGCETHHIESPEEITPAMIRGKTRLGITAGASTPRSDVDAAKKICEEFDD
jgi:4-hydroxy-3-methylbut-2-enyl diphosphate reductase